MIHIEKFGWGRQGVKTKHRSPTYFRDDRKIISDREELTLFFLD